MSLELYLIRHGVTQANLEKRFVGRTDADLHADGAAQVRRLGRSLRQEGITAIVCGPSQRTVASAAILGEVLALPWTALPDFDDMLIPHWDGLGKEEIKRRFGRQYPDWQESPHLFAVPGCETLDCVQKRALAGVAQLARRHDGGRVLLVSHLIVLRCLQLYYDNLPLAAFRNVHLANGVAVRRHVPSSPPTKILSGQGDGRYNHSASGI